MNTLDKITNNLESFSKSELKVAEVILASPRPPFTPASPPWPSWRMSANPPSIASAVASIPRAFPTSKLHLAQSLANGTPM